MKTKEVAVKETKVKEVKPKAVNLTKVQLEEVIVEMTKSLDKATKQLNEQAPLVEKAKLKDSEVKSAKTKATKLENRNKELEVTSAALIEEIHRHTEARITLAAENDSLKDKLTEIEEMFSLATMEQVRMSKEIEKSVLEFNDQWVVLEDTKLQLADACSLEKVVNPVIRFKHWLESCKNNLTPVQYGFVYAATLIILAMFVVSTSFTIGTLVKVKGSEVAGIWTFNILNGLMSLGLLGLVGYVQGWWVILKNKLSSK